ncbi:trans-sialidase, putative, partial [Trypanosoma cruzi marinkellei]
MCPMYMCMHTHACPLVLFCTTRTAAVLPGCMGGA